MAISRHDTWARIFSDLVELIDNAPAPPRGYVDDWTCLEQAEAHAVAVAARVGWMSKSFPGVAVEGLRRGRLLGKSCGRSSRPAAMWT